MSRISCGWRPGVAGCPLGRFLYAMTIRKVRCWLLAIGATCSPQMYGAAKPRLLWELKFSAILAGGPSESKNLQARDLAYSPDGNWIAAVVGLVRTKPESQDDLILIPSTGSTDRVRRIHLEHIAADTLYCKAIFWSPDSVYVAVRLSTSAYSSSFTIFRATDDRPIYSGGTTDEFLGFIDNHRFLAQPGSDADNRPFSRLRDQSIFVFDLDGARPAERPLLGTMRVAVFGPTGVVAVEVSAEKSLVLVDPLTAKIVRRDTVPQDFPRVQLGDGGRIYCLGRWPTQTPPPPISALRVRCFDALTGEESLAVGPVRSGEPFDVARDVPVLAATDSYLSRLTFHAFDETDIGDNVKSVVIWNLHRGVELVRLPGQKQRQRLIGFWNTTNEPYWDRAARLALGPQGDHLAIAADDILSLYEIPTE